VSEIKLYPPGPWENVPERVLSPENCVRHGGHCWYDDQRLMRGDGVQEVGQRCKHCPATRSGKSRDPYEWTYPDGQP
jgi:hypothetical protein